MFSWQETSSATIFAFSNFTPPPNISWLHHWQNPIRIYTITFLTNFGLQHLPLRTWIGNSCIMVNVYKEYKNWGFMHRDECLLSWLIKYGFLVLEEPGFDGNEENLWMLVVERSFSKIWIFISNALYHVQHRHWNKEQLN